jgi:hypothetical protein
LLAAHEQDVQVVGLGDTLSVRGGVGRVRVGLDKGDLVDVVGEDAGGEEAGHAPAENDSMTQRPASHPGARMGKGAHELCSMR